MANKKQLTQHKNIWKIISMSFIALFCLFLIFGLVRVYHFKSAFAKATPEQISLAKELVTQKLARQGDDISKYDFKVSNFIRRPGRAGRTNVENAIQVSLKNDSTAQLYIIDIDKKSILLYSKTEFYDKSFHKRGGRNEYQ
ncbi:hypothetical protein HY485_00185 [Candidatus Woesearchaeota archaeon]|nr:hypothetical protein [Candidatus Woesearchaeota archaeon]